MNGPAFGYPVLPLGWTTPDSKGSRLPRFCESEEDLAKWHQGEITRKTSRIHTDHFDLCFTPSLRNYYTVSAPLQVVLYTKKDCGLCGPAREVLESVQKEIVFALEVIDISEDPALTQSYGSEVPVVLIEGRKAFKGQVTVSALRKKLKKAGELRDRSTVSADVVKSPPVLLKSLLGASLVAACLYFGYEAVSYSGRADGVLAAKLLRVTRPEKASISFKLPKMRGGERTLSELGSGLVFLNFWATWCPPCIEEMPSMVRLNQKMRDLPGFKMVAVSADSGWEPVREFFRADTPGFEVLLDREGAVAKKYGTEKFPETYIFLDGALVGHVIGPRDWDAWYAQSFLREALRTRDVSFEEGT